VTGSIAGAAGDDGAFSDRLARDTVAAALVEQRVQELGAAIRAVDGSGNADTPEGLLVRRIIDTFAEYGL
jgi:DNA invertase Pin-like site-specific DNA recombinase